MDDLDAAAQLRVAAALGCDDIDVFESSDFARVWLWCVVYGCCITAAVMLPLFWLCSDRHRAIHRHLENSEHKEGWSITQPAKKDSDRHPLQFSKAEKGLGASITSAESSQLDFFDKVRLAREHLRRTSPTLLKKESDKKDVYVWRSLWDTELQSLNEIGGTGTELYFRLLRGFGLLFICLSAITSPIAAFSLLGDFAPDTGNPFARTTIGNIGRLTNVSVLSPEERLVVVGCQGMPLRSLTTHLGWIDFISGVIFLLFVVYFRYFAAPKAEKEDDDEQITCSDFSLIIDKLPRTIENQDNYKKELTDFLVERMMQLRHSHGVDLLRQDIEGRPKEKPRDEWSPQVVEVTLVHDLHGQLGDIKWLASMEGKGAKKKKAVLKRLKTTANFCLKNASRPVLRAFVIVSRPDDAQRLIHDYRSGNWLLWRHFQRKDQRFKEVFPLRVQRAPEPSNIIWENQDIRWISRVLRRAITYLLFLILIILVFALTYTVNVAALRGEENGKNSAPPPLGWKGCDPASSRNPVQSTAPNCTLSVKEMRLHDVKESKDKALVDCYCVQAGVSAIIQDNPSGLRSLCASWLAKRGPTWIYLTLASVVSVVVNQILSVVLVQISHFERPLTQSALGSAIMRKVAWAQSINMGLIVSLVHYNAPDGVNDFLTGINTFLGQVIFNAEYNDSVRGWYALVGNSIMLNMLTNAVLPAVCDMVGAWYNDVYRFCCRRRSMQQSELNELYTNPDWDLSFRYAQMITTVVVTMSYSSGMPLLHLFAAAYMLLTYWADKAVLLWGSSRPPQYDASVAKEACEIMFIAIPLHSLMAIIMLGQPCTFPSHTLPNWLMQLDVRDEGSFFTAAALRLTRQSTWMHALLLLATGLLLVWWLCNYIVGQGWAVIKAELEKPLRARARIGSDTGPPLLWTEQVEEIKANYPPASYRLDEHPAYEMYAGFLRRSGICPPCENEKGEAHVAQAHEEIPVRWLKVVKESTTEEMLQLFVQALQAEYIVHVPGAVDQFLKQLDKKQRPAFVKIEDRIAFCMDQEDAISKLTEKLEDVKLPERPLEVNELPGRVPGAAED